MIVQLKTKRRRSRPAGFSLIEAMVSIIIVGIAVTALMAMMASGTQVNDMGNKLSTAVVLVEQARAFTDNLTFEELPDAHNVAWTPVDTTGTTIADMTNYHQKVTVELEFFTTDGENAYWSIE